MRPGRGSNNGPVYDLHAWLIVIVLKVFWSYCSEGWLIKVPRDNKMLHLGAWFPAHLYSRTVSLSACVCVGLRGNINSRDYDRCKFPR